MIPSVDGPGIPIGGAAPGGDKGGGDKGGGKPGGGGDKSSGQREFAPVLARCALAAGANGVFIETHPNPDQALSDGPNMIALADMADVLKSLLKVFAAVQN